MGRTCVLLLAPQSFLLAFEILVSSFLSPTCNFPVQTYLNKEVTVYREHTQMNKAFHPSCKMILTNSARSVLMGELVLLGLSTEAVSSSVSLEE